MKLKRYRMSVDFFLSILSDPQRRGLRNFRVVSGALPSDVEVVRVGYDEDGRLNLILTSEGWDDVQPNGPIDLLPPLVLESVYTETRSIGCSPRQLADAILSAVDDVDTDKAWHPTRTAGERLVLRGDAVLDTLKEKGIEFERDNQGQILWPVKDVKVGS